MSGLFIILSVSLLLYEYYFPSTMYFRSGNVIPCTSVLDVSVRRLSTFSYSARREDRWVHGDFTHADGNTYAMVRVAYRAFAPRLCRLRCESVGQTLSWFEDWERITNNRYECW